MGTTAPTGGSGGGAGCLSCAEFIGASSSCQGAECPATGDVCAGDSRQVLDGLLDCVFCDACPDECTGLCGAGGGGLSEVSGPCQSCLVGALGGLCASPYAACNQS